MWIFWKVDFDMKYKEIIMEWDNDGNVIDRPPIRNNIPPLPPRRREDRGEDPKRKFFWMNDGNVISVNMAANEITNPAGQAVILHPEKFGIPEEQIANLLNRYDPTREEYESFKANKNKYDPEKMAHLWQSSNIIFKEMLKKGWLWGNYVPPEHLSVAVIPSSAQKALEELVDVFPIMQIDDISVTLVTDFSLYANLKYRSNNKTLVFSRYEIDGFGGNLFKMLQWSKGVEEAPQSNWLYFTSYKKPVKEEWNGSENGISSKHGTYNVHGQRKKRYGLIFSTIPLQTKEGEYLYRVPYSIATYKANDVTENERKNTIIITYRGWMFIMKEHFECEQEGKWVGIS